MSGKQRERTPGGIRRKQRKDAGAQRERREGEREAGKLSAPARLPHCAPVGLRGTHGHPRGQAAIKRGIEG